MGETGRDSTADGERGSEESPGVSAMRRSRRRWSAEEKARVVRESFRAGKPVGEVARRHGVSRWQLSAWRSLARAGKLAVPGSARPEPVDVATEPPRAFAALQVDRGPCPGSMESVVIEARGVTVRLQGDIGAQRIAQVASALRGLR